MDLWRNEYKVKYYNEWLINNMSAESVVQALNLVRIQITNLIKTKNILHQVRLVAVSKTKPIDLIMAAYNAGQRHFGENYVKELCDKAKQLPKDIEWHFIGNLQSNKVKQLISNVPHLFMVETVDREKIADALNKAVAEIDREGRDKLKVLVQVNTSGEESKSGVKPEDLVNLVKHVRDKCPNLQFCGLMTIGALEISRKAPSEHEQPDFAKLIECRKQVCEELGLSETSVELSMGMSSDYLIAVSIIIKINKRNLQVEYGSTNVRVGSTIFGSR